MARLHIAAVSMSIVAALGWSHTARADTAEAMCQLVKEGDTRKSASGPCTFSQRQGYVDIDLRNGSKLSLRPTNKANQFKDGDGNAVVRTASGSQHVYKWPDKNKKVIVQFTDEATTRAPTGASTPNGQTPANLRDVVGQPASAAEGMMSARGYDFYKSSVSGTDVYGSWLNRKTGQCVMVHQVANRFVSIVATGPGDCQ